MTELTAPEVIAQANQTQPQLIDQFKKATASQQLAHAFVFAGAIGRGQLMVADWLAMRLLCHHVVDGQPDGTCDQCRRIAAHEHPDVIQIVPDGKTIKVDQVRFLQDEFTKTSVEGGQKIFIVEQAETMTTNAANSLLKFIEEPAGPQTAILMTENKAQILPTLISRSQVIDFRAPSFEQTKEDLTQLGYTENQADLVYQLTDSTELAAEWQQDDWFSTLEQVISNLTTLLLNQDEMAFPLVQLDLLPLVSTDDQKKLVLRFLAQAWRDILLLHDGNLTQSRFNGSDTWLRLAREYTTTTLVTVLEMWLAAPRRLEKNINFQSVVEAAVLESQFKLAGYKK